MFSRRISSSKRTTSLETIPCGDSILYKHKSGYPLASKKVLKPFSISSSHLPLYECKVVDKTLPIIYKIVDSNSNSTRNLRRGSSRRKTGCSLHLNNAFMVIRDQANKKSTKYHWTNLYNIEFPSESPGKSFILTFYQGTDERFKQEKAKYSLTYDLVSIYICPLLEESVTGDIYEIVRGQATIISRSAQILLRRQDEQSVENAENFIRLSVDLFTLVHCGAHPETIESINKLIGHMRNFGEDTSSLEIDFWTTRVGILQEYLLNEGNKGEVVDGVCL